MREEQRLSWCQLWRYLLQKKLSSVLAAAGLMGIAGLLRVGYSPAVARVYELSAAKEFLDDNFLRIYDKIRLAKKKQDGYFSGEPNDFFSAGVKPAWQDFCDFVRNKLNLEVGSGPTGNMVQWFWVKRGVIIDPLANEYAAYVALKFHRQLFRGGLRVFPQEAEVFIPELANKVSGFILMRNTLDHTSDPLAVLSNISRYARQGCSLLLWTDLWHLKNLDEGHRNITRDVTAFKQFISGLGFQILSDLPPVRGDNSTVEYGCVAVKL